MVAALAESDWSIVCLMDAGRRRPSWARCVRRASWPRCAWKERSTARCSRLGSRRRRQRRRYGSLGGPRRLNGGRHRPTAHSTCLVEIQIKRQGANRRRGSRIRSRDVPRLHGRQSWITIAADARYRRHGDPDCCDVAHTRKLRISFESPFGGPPQQAPIALICSSRSAHCGFGNLARRRRPRRWCMRPCCGGDAAILLYRAGDQGRLKRGGQRHKVDLEKVDLAVDTP